MLNDSESYHYPHGLRYIPKKDTEGYSSDEGIEEYNKETNESINSTLRRYSGSISFNIKDLIFCNNFSSSSTTDDRKIIQREYCKTENAEFGTFHGNRNHYVLSFLGTNRTIKDISIVIRPTDNDDDVEFASFSSLKFLDDMFSDDESFGIEVKIQTSLFSTIKELAFSEKLENLTLSIEGYCIDGIYINSDYHKNPYRNVRILEERDMIENHEEMPAIYTDHKEHKPSKNFSLSYSTKKFPFESNESNESNE